MLGADALNDNKNMNRIQTLQSKKPSCLSGVSGRAGWLIWVKCRGGSSCGDVSKVPAGVSQRFSKVGSFAKNPSSSFDLNTKQKAREHKDEERRWETTVENHPCDGGK